MDTPPPDYAYYSIVKSLNLFDAQGVMWACIGGYPAQWLRAYHNNDKNINYIGGDE